MTAKTTPRRRGRPRKGEKPVVSVKKPLGEIDSSKSYSLDRFMDILGCNWHTFRDMRRRGLIVRKDGRKRIMIRGVDYNDYLASLPPEVANHNGTSVVTKQPESTPDGGTDGSG